ncbi:DUF4158 domain-containing protein [Nonomuraea roseola]|uniref:DUF4158 domain-containing protein n=1 Tax=Nonomuraea roseola TaxID=46179 RepID=UPI003D15A21C
MGSAAAHARAVPGSFPGRSAGRGPTEVLDYLAEQLGIFDASCVKTYAQREGTHREHAGKIQKVFRLREFAEDEAELVSVLAAHTWNSGDGPTALFQRAVRWLREHDVLLPGITTLTRLLAAAPTSEEVEELERLAGGACGRADVEAGALADRPVQGLGAGDGQGVGPGGGDPHLGSGPGGAGSICAGWWIWPVTGWGRARHT